MNYELTKICTDKISEYLSDCDLTLNEIFDAGDYITIFGGAVRDPLAGKEIHDIDIMCLPISAISVSKLLKEKGFMKVDLFDKMQLSMYIEIHCISEPWTFIKNSKIIQVIRPAGGRLSTNDGSTIGSLIDSYYSLLSDVDISACGVFIERDRDGVAKLKESYPSAITHCRSCVFKTLKNNRMFGENRTNMRTFKLVDRGWKNISESNDIKDERRIKLMGLPTHGLQKPEYSYKYYKGTKPKTLVANNYSWITKT